MNTTFMIADDDTDDAEMFCEALHQVAPGKMCCLKVENGQALFEALSGEEMLTPDIIFLDINMPVMNGWQCLAKLQEDSSLRTIPTIMYSTSSSKKDIDRAYALGATFFVTKPEDFDELCGILKVFATNTPDTLVTELRHFPSVKIA